MDYELCKKLKDNRFPQKGKGWWFRENGEEHIIATWKEECIYSPTLSELIYACGEKFENLTYLKKDKWLCNYLKDQETGYIWRDSIGLTPEEAVANLWLKLHENKS